MFDRRRQKPPRSLLNFLNSSSGVVATAWLPVTGLITPRRVADIYPSVPPGSSARYGKILCFPPPRARIAMVFFETPITFFRRDAWYDTFFESGVGPRTKKIIAGNFGFPPNSGVGASILGLHLYIVDTGVLVA